jgi:hypothetical protein
MWHSISDLIIAANVGIMVFFFSCFWLTPGINRARDDRQSTAFKALHWASVGRNMAQLLIFVAPLYFSVHKS